MTNLEVRQQLKNTALNEIRKIYNPNYKFPYDYSYIDEYDESYSEQREYRIEEIIQNLERDLNKLSIKS